MAQPAKSQEPSMDEVLASIRRVLAEDASKKSAQLPVGTEKVEVKADVASLSAEPERAIGDSLRSTPSGESPGATIGMLSETAKAARSTAIVDLPDPMASSASLSATAAFDSRLAPEAAPLVDAASNEALSVPQSGGTHDERGGLTSNATSAVVDSAFNTLAQTVLVHNARTLDDLVREMLRPILKVWLDNNLPGIVERLVRTEIDRVSRGRGG